MQTEQIQACIIPSTDPYIGEYTPDRWKTRAWLSGFTGSAGTVVVTMNKAGLWTDSRYFLQAEEQLKGSGIGLYKTGLPGTPTFSDWIGSELSAGDCVGIEGAVFAASEAKSLIEFFSEKRLKVRTDFAPYDSLWKNRPAVPANPAFILPECFAGKSCRKKIREVVAEIKKNQANATILAASDTIAWLFNIRGNDVNYNPVCVSYAVVSENETVLFISPDKLTQGVSDYFRKEGIITADYEKIADYIQKALHGATILITPSKINYRLYSILLENCVIKETSVHPADLLKSIKNATEIAGIRNAMQKDGVAMVKFLMDLEKALANNETITELDVAEKLRTYRSEQALYFGESFKTIAGYGAHGAVVHYEATPESNAVIHPDGILLIDSGAQYFDGTTDITRTVSTGQVSETVKRNYTWVLKGHIQLASAIFPAGTVGMQLDILARQALWKAGQNFLHGTGHGVGCFLNVHEGPQSIRMNYNPTPLEPGMITSDEPGLYLAGEYGIRIENLLLTVQAKTTEFGDFYTFETLTLCPIDTRLIDCSLLYPEEINRLNAYHQRVRDRLTPLLSPEEAEWLKEQTKPIGY
ncbi:MAG: aminopeptidase P family protein [Candidatus Azobacteroides sp.]|nr:aminopeptidase P family protein [Candidatus Azobacteroides sp.]